MSWRPVSLPLLSARTKKCKFFGREKGAFIAKSSIITVTSFPFLSLSLSLSLSFAFVETKRTCRSRGLVLSVLGFPSRPHATMLQFRSEHRACRAAFLPPFWRSHCQAPVGQRTMMFGRRSAMPCFSSSSTSSPSLILFQFRYLHVQAVQLSLKESDLLIRFGTWCSTPSQLILRIVAAKVVSMLLRWLVSLSIDDDSCSLRTRTIFRQELIDFRRAINLCPRRRNWTLPKLSWLEWTLTRASQEGRQGSMRRSFPTTFLCGSNTS